MKKTITTLLAVAFIGMGTITTQAGNLEILDDSQVAQHIVVESNVGNGEAYDYVITEVIGNEIHGLPTNKESYTNRGIFLFQDEVSFDVEVGDEISVVWGEEEDIFASIVKK